MGERMQVLGVCSVCGARGVEMSRASVDVGTQRRPMLVDPGFDYEHCTACGEDLIPADRLDELFREAVRAERSRDALLDSAEIRSLRFELGLTQDRLERLLGVSPRTVTRWESGTVRQSRIADNFMRVLGAHPELVAEAMGAVAREGRGPYRPRK
jgi:putative zinc finger/helix-turn-helix YgiT family protein